MKSLIKKTAILSAVLMAFVVLSESEAMAYDPRLDRIISILEKMDSRIGRLESRVYGGGYGGGGSVSPVNYGSPFRNVSYSPSSNYGGGYDIPIGFTGGGGGGMPDAYQFRVIIYRE